MMMMKGGERETDPSLNLGCGKREWSFSVVFLSASPTPSPSFHPLPPVIKQVFRKKIRRRRGDSVWNYVLGRKRKCWGKEGWGWALVVVKFECAGLSIQFGSWTRVKHSTAIWKQCRNLSLPAFQLYFNCWKQFRSRSSNEHFPKRGLASLLFVYIFSSSTLIFTSFLIVAQELSVMESLGQAWWGRSTSTTSTSWRKKAVTYRCALSVHFTHV